MSVYMFVCSLNGELPTWEESEFISGTSSRKPIHQAGNASLPAAGQGILDTSKDSVRYCSVS